MKSKCVLLITVTTVLMSITSSAQIYNIVWGTNMPWANGATMGTATNVGGSGINCTVRLVISGGIYPVYSGVPTPTINNPLNVLPGSSKALSIMLDYTLNTQYTDITITFSGHVSNVFFRIGDIDRNDP